MKHVVQNLYSVLLCLLLAASGLHVHAQIVSDVKTGNRTDANTKVRELDRVVDSLQTALGLPMRNVMPETTTGSRKNARLDERALAATIADMYAELGIEEEIPTRITPRLILSIMNSILLAAAETPPTVQTKIAEGIEATLAILNGAVTKDGRKPLDYWGFKLGTDSTLSDSLLVPFGDYQGFLDTSAVDTGAFYLEKTGLSPSTTYYFSAWAENVNGIAHGDTLSFVTLVETETRTAINLSDSTGTLRASFQYGDEPPTATGFKWGVDSTLLVAADSTLVMASDSTIALALSELEKDSTYYYVGYATNASGTQFGDTLSFVASNDPCAGETSVTYNGYDYQVKGILENCWFTENLRTSTLNDGTEMITTVPPLPIDSLGPAMFKYLDSDSIFNIYGGLYNASATMSGKLCPNDWHVASYDEFQALSQSYSGWDRIYALMNEDWDDGTNESGLNALPNGSRNIKTGDYHEHLNLRSNFMTAQVNSAGYVMFAQINTWAPSLQGGATDYTTYLGVRCIKDTE